MNKQLIISAIATVMTSVSVMAESLGEATLTPAQGTVDKIETITVDYPSTGLMGIDRPDCSGITLTRQGDGAVYTVAKADYAMGTSATLHFAPTGETTPVTITAAGVYTLSVPAGAFKEFFSNPVKANEAFTATYTIEDNGGDTPEPEPDPSGVFGQMTSVPADHQRVGSFTKAVITFPGLGNDGLNFPIDASAITLNNADGSLSWAGHSVQVSGGYKTLTVNFHDAASAETGQVLNLTEAGDYTITIPAGLLKEYGTSNVCPEIKLNFTVDPTLNFSYTLSPADGSVSVGLPAVSVAASGSMTTLDVKPATGLTATLSHGETAYTLTPRAVSATETAMDLAADAVRATGEWTLTIPAGYFYGTGPDGIVLENNDPITATYTVKDAKTFGYMVSPAEGETVERFRRVSVELAGIGLKKVKVNNEAGTATLSDGTNEYQLKGAVSSKRVNFTLTEGLTLADGTYTATIPAGLIVTVDDEALEAAVGQITTTFTVARPALTDFTDGMLIVNEGWYGNDPGSVNFMSNDNEMTYDAFALANPDRLLGVTSQYGDRYGDRVYVVSKQSRETNGVIGGMVTAMNAETLKWECQIDKLPAQSNAFCGVSATKGYVSTKKGIYVINLEDMTLGNVVEGTDVGRYCECGDMVKMGKYVFATHKLEGVIAIDTETDKMTVVDAPTAVGLTVTADGSLYAATQNEDAEFVRIDPVTLATENIDVPGTNTKIANIWPTWRKPPLAADVSDNVVYYATAVNNAKTVSRFDLDKREYDPEFIKLPVSDNGEQMELYGQGVSVDPATGDIVLMAVEGGYGTHYMVNAVYRVDPATGIIDKGNTVTFKPYYWFPAMAVFPDFDAPELTLTDIAIDKDRPYQLELADATTLRTGNAHLIDYAITGGDAETLSVAALGGNGAYALTGLKGGKVTLEVTATYRGLATTAHLTVTVNDMSGIADVAVEGADDGGVVDVYTTTGALVRRGVSRDAIGDLAPGIYIIGGEKVLVK